MPLIEVTASLDRVLHSTHRILQNGAPNSGKTAAIWTAKGPVTVITLPGEKGDASIPLTTRDGISVKSFKFDLDPNAPGISYRTEVDAVVKLIKEVIAGKHGPCNTLLLDGAHKLYNAIFMAACGGSPTSIDDKFVGRKYGESHLEFGAILDLVNRSTIPYVVWNCWDGVKVDSQIDKPTKDSPKSVYVGLPGKMGRDVVGEFAFVLHNYTVGAGSGRQYKWRLEPQGDIESAGRKIPRDLVSKLSLPSTIDQDFGALDKLLTTEITRAWQEIHNTKETQ
jgi:hypothetical protein